MSILSGMEEWMSELDSQSQGGQSNQCSSPEFGPARSMIRGQHGDCNEPNERWDSEERLFWKQRAEYRLMSRAAPIF